MMVSDLGVRQVPRFLPGLKSRLWPTYFARSSALASAQIRLGGTQHRHKRAILAVLAGAPVDGRVGVHLGCACAIVFFADRDCSAAGHYGCAAYPLAGMFVLALAGVLLILIAAVAISYLCCRD